MRAMRGRRLTEAARLRQTGPPIFWRSPLKRVTAPTRHSPPCVSRSIRLHAPEMIRAQRNLNNIELMEPIKMDETLQTNLEPPLFVDGGTLLIAGLSERYNSEASAHIPAQWQRFAPHLGHIPGQIGRAAYGVICNSDDAGNADYICGVEVSDAARLPPEFTRLRIPEQRYAVFFFTVATSQQFGAPGSLSGTSGCRNRGIKWPRLRNSSYMARLLTRSREWAASRSGCRLRSDVTPGRGARLRVWQKAETRFSPQASGGSCCA